MGGFQQSVDGEYEHGTVESHYIDTPEQVGLRFSIAGIGSRFVAEVLDLLILGVCLAIEFAILVWIGSAADHSDAVNKVSDKAAYWGLAILVLLNFAFVVCYASVFETFWKGQTPGKRAMKIRVIKDTGRQITFFEALTRSLVGGIDWLPSFYLVGLVVMLCNKQSKRLGDFAAGTIVVHERLEDQPLVVQPTAMIYDGANRSAQPIEPWRGPNVPAMFAADAVAKLSAKDLVVIESYFGRALDLTLELRATMALRLAQQMAAKMGVALPEGNPERALESIAFAMRSAGRANW